MNNKKVLYYPGNPIQLDQTIQQHDTLDRIRKAKNIGNDKIFYLMKQIQDEKQKVEDIIVQNNASFIVLTQLGTPKNIFKLQEKLNGPPLIFTFKNRELAKEFDISIDPKETIHVLDSEVNEKFEFKQHRVQYILNGKEIDEHECAASISARNRCDRPIYVFETSKELKVIERMKSNAKITTSPSNNTEGSEYTQKINNPETKQTKSLQNADESDSQSSESKEEQYTELLPQETTTGGKQNPKSKRNSILVNLFDNDTKETEKQSKTTQQIEENPEEFISIIENKPQKSEKQEIIQTTENSEQKQELMQNQENSEQKLILCKLDKSIKLEVDISNINTFDDLTEENFNSFGCPNDEIISYMDPTNGDIIEMETSVSKYSGKTVIFGISGSIDKKSKEIKDKQNQPYELQEKLEEEEEEEHIVDTTIPVDVPVKMDIPSDKVFVFAYDTKIGMEADADETTLEMFNDKYFDEFKLNGEAEIVYVDLSGKKIDFDQVLKNFGGNEIVIRYVSDLDNPMKNNYENIMVLPVESKNEEEIQIIEHHKETVDEKKEEENDDKIELISLTKEDVNDKEIVEEKKPPLVDQNSEEENLIIDENKEENIPIDANHEEENVIIDANKEKENVIIDEHKEKENVIIDENPEEEERIDIINVNKNSPIEEKTVQKEEESADENDFIQIIEEKPMISTPSEQTESNGIQKLEGLVPKDKVFLITLNKSFKIQLDADSTTFNDFHDKYYDDFNLEEGYELIYEDILDNTIIDIWHESLISYGGKVILIGFKELYDSLDMPSWIDYIKSCIVSYANKEETHEKSDGNDLIIEKVDVKTPEFNDEKSDKDEDDLIIEKVEINTPEIKEENIEDDVIIDNNEEDNCEGSIKIIFQNSNDFSSETKIESSFNKEKTFNDVKNELIERCPNLKRENIIFRDCDYVAIDDSENVSFYKDQVIYVIKDSSIDLSNNQEDTEDETRTL